MYVVRQWTFKGYWLSAFSLSLSLSLSSLHALFLSTAVPTVERECSREAGFFHRCSVVSEDRESMDMSALRINSLTSARKLFTQICTFLQKA